MTNPMTKAEQPTNTQADKELLEELQCVTTSGFMGGYIMEVEGLEIIARHRTTSLAAQDGLVEALAMRDKSVEPCPADKRSLGDKDCPKCGSSSAGPCWLKVSADSTFVDSARTALSAIKGDKS